MSHANGAALVPPRPASGAATHDPLRLLPGVELLGRVQGSGLREAPYYIRRADGEVVQLSELLYVVAEQAGPGRSLEEIAGDVGPRLGLNVRPEQVRYVLEQKLHPLGLVSGSDGSAPGLERLDPLLALKFRVGVLRPEVVRAIAGPLSALFRAPVVVALLGFLLAFDGWLVGVHGIGRGLSHVIQHPALMLMLVGITYASLAVHECGHAAACARGGARPGAIGIGVYLVWPVLYTDVTDSYRLGKRGRLRTDLGGVYFNAIVAVGLAAAYMATGFEPLLLGVVGQHLIVLDQFLPWVRLDGYYVVADLIGVSDLFSRIKPVLRGLVPGRPRDPRVRELKGWAQAAVTAWVLTTVSILLGVAVLTAVHAPAYVSRTWASLVTQTDAVGHAAAAGHVVAALASGFGCLFLVLPVVGTALIYVLLCRRAGAGLAVNRARAAGLMR